MAFDLKSARHWAEELLRQAAGPGAVVAQQGSAGNRSRVPPAYPVIVIGKRDECNEKV